MVFYKYNLSQGTKVNSKCAVGCNCKNDPRGFVSNYNGLFQSAMGCT